jgi:hypothetical protein
MSLNTFNIMTDRCLGFDLNADATGAELNTDSDTQTKLQAQYQRQCVLEQQEFEALQQTRSILAQQRNAGFVICEDDFNFEIAVDSFTPDHAAVRITNVAETESVTATEPETATENNPDVIMAAEMIMDMSAIMTTDISTTDISTTDMSATVQNNNQMQNQTHNNNQFQPPHPAANLTIKIPPIRIPQPQFPQRGHRQRKAQVGKQKQRRRYLCRRRALQLSATARRAAIRDITYTHPGIVEIFSRWQTENIEQLGAVFCRKMFNYLLMFHASDIEVMNSGDESVASIGDIFIEMNSDDVELKPLLPTTKKFVDPMAFFKYMIETY